MRSQQSDTFRRYLAPLIFAVSFLLGAPALAQSDSLDGAVTLLRDGQYERGLEVLRSLDNSGDPRVDYYRGYALEKMGECDGAKSAYSDAVESATNPRLRAVAEDALSGFDGRCKPAAAAASPAAKSESAASTPAPEATTRAPLGAGRVGWKVFGWTSAILGGVVLTAVPVKAALEDNAFDRTSPYFEERYGCEVESGQVDGESCDKAALSDDPVYEAYEQNRKVAKTAERYMLIGGTTLAGVGVATLITVALTRPSAPVRWGVAPTDGGAQVGATLRF